jgi:hypothetical protein
MFSSMLIDSIMNTSMNIAQECLNEPPVTQHTSAGAAQDSQTWSSSAANNSLLGLEAFASTIDSILSRIKINLEQIQIRVEDLDAGAGAGAGAFSNSSTFSNGSSLNSDNIMSSSTVINNRPANGIALELRIKSIKYFDLDSQQPNQATQAQKQQPSSLVISFYYWNLFYSRSSKFLRLDLSKSNKKLF